MKRFLSLLLFALVMVSANAVYAGGRRRAVQMPQRVTMSVPFSVGLDYGPGHSGPYIFTVHKDGSMWYTVYAPYALGNSMPETVLSLSLAPVDLVILGLDKPKGVRFFSKGDAVHSGAILPFDPMNPMPEIDNFIAGTEVDELVQDCPIQGIPNNAKLTRVSAYVHFRSYLVIDPVVYIIDDVQASEAHALATLIGGPDGVPVLLMDHYQDGDGAWWVAASQVLRDKDGNIIVSNPSQRRCTVFR